MLNQKLAHYPDRLHAGFYHMFCYSVVVCSQLVGDAYALFLRIIDVQGTHTNMVTQLFDLPYYLPVSKQHIETIRLGYVLL